MFPKWKLKHNTKHLYKLFKLGKKIIDLSLKYDFPPMAIVRQFLMLKKGHDSSSTPSSFGRNNRTTRKSARSVGFSAVFLRRGGRFKLGIQNWKLDMFETYVGATQLYHCLEKHPPPWLQVARPITDIAPKSCRSRADFRPRKTTPWPNIWGLARVSSWNILYYGSNVKVSASESFPVSPEGSLHTARMCLGGESAPISEASIFKFFNFRLSMAPKKAFFTPLALDISLVGCLVIKEI